MCVCDGSEQGCMHVSVRGFHSQVAVQFAHLTDAEEGLEVNPCDLQGLRGPSNSG